MLILKISYKLIQLSHSPRFLRQQVKINEQVRFLPIFDFQHLIQQLDKFISILVTCKKKLNWKTPTFLGAFTSLCRVTPWLVN